MVPGAERRLKERHGVAGEYLVQHQNKYQRHEPDASGSLTSGNYFFCCCCIYFLLTKTGHFQIIFQRDYI